MTDERSPERSVNDALLRHLQGIATNVSPVAQTSLFPANRQESLVITLDAAYYPSAIDTARLEIRAYTNGAFHITYLENHNGQRRLCRWDRHEQPHNSRDHFHPCPDAGTQQALDRDFPKAVPDVLRSDVFPWIEQRLGDLWDTHA